MSPTSNSRTNTPDSSVSTGLRVNARLSIPLAELVVRATRSSGAGGQHVNKTASRIELVWNVQTSQVLSDLQRDRLLTQLATRLTSEGDLRIVVSDTRSQYQNREIAELRLVELVRDALVIPKVRKATRPSKRQKQARLDAKHRRGEKKKERRKGPDFD